MWESAIKQVHGFSTDEINSMKTTKHSSDEERGKFKIYAMNGYIDTIDKGFVVQYKCSKVKSSNNVALAVKDCVPVMY